MLGFVNSVFGYNSITDSGLEKINKILEYAENLEKINKLLEEKVDILQTNITDAPMRKEFIEFRIENLKKINQNLMKSFNP